MSDLSDELGATDGTEPSPEETRASVREKLRAARRLNTTEVQPAQRTDSRRPSSPEREVDLPRPTTDYVSVKADLQSRLIDEITERNLIDESESEVQGVVDDFVSRVLDEEAVALNREERERLGDELREETTGVGPLAALMADPSVTDILVNSPSQVYVERFGRLEKSRVRFRDNEHVIRVIERIAAGVGRRVDASSPLLDARLPDGSRVNATLPPVSIDGPTLSIRRFGKRRLRCQDLLRLDMYSPDMLEVLTQAVRVRRSVLVSGGTGAGKSTLLGAFCEAIPHNERVVTIEDTAELILDQEHVVRLETRPPNVEGEGRISARDLVVNALRMRPDRIIVGEVRSGEALDMLQALNTGHDGGLSTIHSNSPRDAIARLETMVLMSGLELPSRAIREQIQSAIDLIVHVRRYEDGVRRVENVSEVAGMEGDTILLNEIFNFERRGVDAGRVLGSHQPSGVVPRFVDDLRARGLEISTEMFRRAGGDW
ncbi:MAG: CpaF family protein [Planctomycetota bacterium]